MRPKEGHPNPQALEECDEHGAHSQPAHEYHLLRLLLLLFAFFILLLWLLLFFLTLSLLKVNSHALGFVLVAVTDGGVVDGLVGFLVQKSEHGSRVVPILGTTLGSHKQQDHLDVVESADT